MKVFILMDGDYEEIQVDSIWSTKDLAQNRCNYLGRDYSDISTVEIDDFGIELLDNPAWSVRKYPGADAVYVEKRYGHVDLLEVDKVYFSNKLLPKIEHPIGGVLLISRTHLQDCVANPLANPLILVINAATRG